MGFCTITSVKAPNKKSSILFKTLETEFGQDEALKTWALVNTDSFKNEFGNQVFKDQNGEPALFYLPQSEQLNTTQGRLGVNVDSQFGVANVATSKKTDADAIPHFIFGSRLLEFKTLSEFDKVVKAKYNVASVTAKERSMFLMEEHQNDTIVKVQENYFLPSVDALKPAIDLQDSTDVFETIREKARVEQNNILTSKLIQLLGKYGIKVELFENLQTDKGLKALGIADIINRLVKVINNAESSKHLAEETGHFIYELLGRDNPLIAQLEKLALNSVEFEEIVDRYAEEYNNNSEKLIKETVGQLIGKHLLNALQSNPEYTANENSILKTIRRVWERIKQLFSTTKNSDIESQISEVYGNLAVSVLNGSIDLDANNLTSKEVYYSIEAEEGDEEIPSTPEENNAEKVLSKLDKVIIDVKNAIEVKIQVLKKSGSTAKAEKRNQTIKNLQLAQNLLDSKDIDEGLVIFLKKALSDAQLVRKRFRDMLNSDTVDVAKLTRLLDYVEVYTPELITEIVEELRKDPELDGVIPDQFIDDLTASLTDVDNMYQTLAKRAVRAGASKLIVDRTNITTEQLDMALSYGSGDISWFKRWTDVLAKSPDTLIAYGATLINTTIEKTRLESLEVKKKLSKLTKEFETYRSSQGINIANSRALYDIFLEKKNGKLTGKLISLSEAQKTLSETEMDFYRQYVKIYFNAQKKLPLKVKRGNMLPSIRAGVQELIYAGKSKDVAKAWASDAFTVQEDDSGFAKNDVGAKHVPILYHSQVGNRTRIGKDKKEVTIEGLDPEKITYDLAESLLAYSTMAINNFNMNQIVDDLEVLKDVLAERKHVRISGNKIIKNKNKKYGTEVDRAETDQGDTTNAYKQFVLAMDMIVYGEQKSTDSWTLPNGQQINKTKAADTLLKYTSFRSLALNVFSGINNFVVGNIQNFFEAYGGIDIDMKSYKRAKKLYWASMSKGEILTDRNKKMPESFIGQLSEQFDAFQDFDQYTGEMKENTLMKRLFKSSNLFFMQKGGEHEIQTTLLLGYLGKKKVKTDSGEEISLLDAYHQVDGQLQLKEGVQYTQEDLIKDVQHFKGLSQKLHGVYSNQDLVGAQHEWQGRMALLFRKWVVPTYGARWEEKYYDARLDRWQEGKYRTAVRFWWKFHKEAKALEMSYWKYYSEKKKSLEPWELANLRKTRIGALTTMGMVALVAMLGGSDDDDEKRSWIANMTLYQASRVRQELFMYVNPIDAIQILRTPSASLSAVENAFKLVKESVSAGYGFISEGDIPRYERDTGLYNEGDAKWLKPFEEAVPIWKEIRAMQAPENRLKYMLWK